MLRVQRRNLSQTTALRLEAEAARIETKKANASRREDAHEVSGVDKKMCSRYGLQQTEEQLSNSGLTSTCDQHFRISTERVISLCLSMSRSLCVSVSFCVYVSALSL